MTDGHNNNNGRKFNISWIEWLWPIVAASGWALAFVGYYTGGFTTRINDLEIQQAALTARVEQMGERGYAAANEFRQGLQQLRAERQVVTEKMENEIGVNKAQLDAEISANKVRIEATDRFESQWDRNLELIVTRIQQLQSRLDTITSEFRNRRDDPSPPFDPRNLPRRH